MPQDLGGLSIDMGEETPLFSMPFIVFLIILFAIILLVVIFSIRAYQKHLDRVVEGKERDVHTRVAEPRTVLAWVVAVLLAIFTINTMVENAALRTQMENMEQALVQNQQYLSSQIQALENKLDEQDKLAEEYDFSFGKIDTQEKTVEVLFTVQLKEYTVQTRATISYGSSSCELENKNGKFVGTLKAPLFEDCEPCSLVVVNGDDIKGETLENTFSGKLGNMILNTGDDWCSGYESEWSKDGKFRVHGTQGVAIKEWLPKENTKGVKLTFRVNGVVVKSIPIPIHDGEGSIDFDETFQMAASASFDMWLESELECGWTASKKVGKYEQSVGFSYCLGNEVCVYGEQGQKIYVPKEED
ncbi:MAG: hypothetical protein IKG93_05585 [Clostridiales bacterium]|nr:hypothetical protein [Clostridiales bacterium]